MNRHGLRARILLFSIIPILAAGCGLAFFFTATSYTRITDKLIKDAERIIYPLGTAVSYAMKEHNQSLVQGIINESFRQNNRDVLTIAVFDKNNKMLAASSISNETDKLRLRTEAGQYITPQPNIEYTDDGFIMRMPIYAYDESEMMTLYDDSTDREVDTPITIRGIEYPRDVAGYICIYIINSTTILSAYTDIVVAVCLILVALLISILFGINLNSVIVDPINKLSTAIYEMREGNVNIKINGTMLGELERLRSYINTMANTMQEFHNEMQYSVDIATNDLRKTLDKLDNQNHALEKATSDAKTASRIKSEFLANMSHELRTPLNGIIGFAKQLEKHPQEQEQQEYLLTIENCARNLLGIVNNILDFSKLESGKLTFEKIPFSIRKVAYDVIKLLTPQAQESGIELTVTIDKDIPENAIGDPLRTGQVFTNLLGNSVKFTKKGNVALDVSLAEGSSVRNSTFKINCTVRDTGIGISDEQQKKLFSAFSQADSSTARKYGGTGLGLVITERLIHEMHGNISMSSAVGKGTTFSFSLEFPRGEISLPSIKNNKNIVSHKKIALVEMNTWVREAIKKQLEEWHMDVITMSSITPVGSLPDKDGLSFLLIGLSKDFDFNHFYGEFANISVNNNTKIVIAINTLDESVKNRLRGISPSITVISKPILPEQLFEALTSKNSAVLPNSHISNAPEEEHLISKPKKRNVVQSTVLAVDDNPANLMLIKTLLSEFVSDVYTAENGIDAVEMCLHTEFNLIFMDIQMPGMDGITTMKNIRSCNTNKDTPIIAVTALAAPEEQRSFIQEGMTDCLSKPLEEDKLRQLVTEYCGKIPTDNNDVLNTSAPENTNSVGNFNNTNNDNALWTLEDALKVTARKKDLAKDMLTMFLNSVPDFEKTIQEREKIPALELAPIVHKFAGSAVYSGLPKVKKLCNIIEKTLKETNNQEDCEPELLELEDTIERIKKEGPSWLAQLN